MSVINRMLSDLERRGAPVADSDEQDMRPAAAQRRRRRIPARVGVALLALVLVGVAGALWLQRSERILAAFTPGAERTPRPVPEIVGFSFDRRDGRHRFAVRVNNELEREPRFSRSGGSATLVLDAASPDLLLPAPPAGQGVFRGISLDADPAAPTRVRLELDDAAELELVVGERVVSLLGPEPVVAGGSADAVPVPASLPEGSAQQDPQASAVAPEGAEGESGSTGGEADGEPVQRGAATEETESAAESEAPATRSAAVANDPGPETGRTGSAADGGAEHGTDAAALEAARVEPESEGTVRKTRSTSPETRARRRYREGRDAIGRGELASARRALREALELDPALHPARDLLVGLYRRGGDSAAARRLLERGVEMAPARAEYAMPYARLLVDIGELDRAAEVLADARRNGAGSAGYHALVAAVQQRRGEHRIAASEYTRALELRAGNGLWWLGLGVSLAALDKPVEARAAFREARASGTLSESLDRWAQGRIETLSTGNEG